VGSPWYTVTTVYFTRCRLGDPGRKIASSCEEFEYSEGGVYSVYVYENSGTGLPGLSQIKGR